MFTPEGNLQSVLTVMKFDGDYDLRPGTHNLAYMISEEEDLQLWFVSLTTPDSDVEAFVVADKKGNFTFFDDSSDSLVVDNKLIHTDMHNIDVLDQIIDAYDIDGASPTRPPKPGHIKALLDVLHQLAGR